MQSVAVSAPAKLFILGEHAVVYDGTAIVSAVDARLHLKLQVTTAPLPTVTIQAPDVGLQDWQAPLASVLSKDSFAGESRFIEATLVAFHQQHPLQHNIYIETHSSFDRNYGLGSSSATVAATLFALSRLFAPHASNMQLFEMGLEAILLAQGKIGSGADLAAAIQGGTIYYKNQRPRQITPLSIPTLPIVAVYSGQKAGTTSYVRQVKAVREQHPNLVDSIIQTMLDIVEEGKVALLQQNWLTLGRLMNVQHGLLHAIGVDTRALAEVVFAARSARCDGAKLSGAGGGDCAIVLASTAAQREALSTQLDHIGRTILPYTLNADGVRVEEQ